MGNAFSVALFVGSAVALLITGIYAAIAARDVAEAQARNPSPCLARVHTLLTIAAVVGIAGAAVLGVLFVLYLIYGSAASPVVGTVVSNLFLIIALLATATTGVMSAVSAEFIDAVGESADPSYERARMAALIGIFVAAGLFVVFFISTVVGGPSAHAFALGGTAGTVAAIAGSEAEKED